MKNRFLKFLRKYWFCFLLSIIMVIGTSLSSHYANLYEIAGDNIRFDLSDLYIMYGIPIYSFLYGCLSFVFLKKMWVQHAILYIVTFISFFVTNLINERINLLLFILIVSLSFYPILFSFIGTLISVLVKKIVKSIEENTYDRG